MTIRGCLQVGLSQLGLVVNAYLRPKIGVLGRWDPLNGERNQQDGEKGTPLHVSA